MRMCLGGCQTLKWVNGRYEGTNEGGQAPSTLYTLNRWGADGVVIDGKSILPVSGPYHATGLFTGRIAPGGGILADGKVNWRTGPNSGILDFQLSWQQAPPPVPPATVPDAARKEALSDTPRVVQPPAPPKPVPRIIPVNDDEIADDEFKPHPPPKAAWHPAEHTVAEFDLSGMWEGEYSGKYAETISVIQINDHVVIRTLKGRPLFEPNHVLAVVQYGEPRSAKGLIAFEDRSVYRMKDMDATLSVTDRDHFQVTDKYFTEPSYHRISSTPLGDVPCETDNPRHIDGITAYALGDIYSRAGDLGTGTCWFYVSAMQGYPDGLGAYGMSLALGRGMESNPKEAFLWFQQAAMQGSYIGPQNLTTVFHDGTTAPQSIQRYNYWLARFMGLSPSLVHDKNGNTLRPWMLDTVKACEASNPSHVDADHALAMGRVAYQARALGTAHCWFRVSALQGNAKAYTYLGILSAFGLGVDTNKENALKYMSHAAANGDAYAKVYLAEFYRYGIGTTPDMGAASNLLSEAFRDPNAVIAFTRIEGTLLSDSEAVTAAGRLIRDSAAESDCLARAKQDRDNHIQREHVCEGAVGNFMASQNSGHPTILDPEEIYPEIPFWPMQARK